MPYRTKKHSRGLNTLPPPHPPRHSLGGNPAKMWATTTSRNITVLPDLDSNENNNNNRNKDGTNDTDDRVNTRTRTRAHHNHEKFENIPTDIKILLLHHMICAIQHTQTQRTDCSRSSQRGTKSNTNQSKATKTTPTRYPQTVPVLNSHLNHKLLIAHQLQVASEVGSTRPPPPTAAPPDCTASKQNKHSAVPGNR